MEWGRRIGQDSQGDLNTIWDFQESFLPTAQGSVSWGDSFKQRPNLKFIRISKWKDQLLGILLPRAEWSPNSFSLLYLRAVIIYLKLNQTQLTAPPYLSLPYDLSGRKLDDDHHVPIDAQDWCRSGVETFPRKRNSAWAPACSYCSLDSDTLFQAPLLCILQDFLYILVTDLPQGQLCIYLALTRSKGGLCYSHIHPLASEVDSIHILLSVRLRNTATCWVPTSLLSSQIFSPSLPPASPVKPRILSQAFNLSFNLSLKPTFLMHISFSRQSRVSFFL